MLKQVPIQKSAWIVVDSEVYGVKAPEGYSEYTKSIKNVLVSGRAGSFTELFKGASVQSVDPIDLH